MTSSEQRVSALRTWLHREQRRHNVESYRSVCTMGERLSSANRKLRQLCGFHGGRPPKTDPDIDRAKCMLAVLWMAVRR